MKLPTEEECRNMRSDEREEIFKNFLMEGTVTKAYEQYAAVINGTNKFVKEIFFDYFKIEDVEKGFDEIKSKSNYEEIKEYGHGIIPAALKNI
ncbi:MAG: hypothetical protein LBC87_08520 [Fibromonadaceae bacterium]|jgi:hypothetical protein|nr:hypothetical protein [Fibromonadaceae bacterium]